MTDRRADYLRLMGLLNPASPNSLSTWDAGEWEFAIEDLATQLAEWHTPLRRADRVELLELAAAYGVTDRVRALLRWCLDPDAEDERWQDIEDSTRATHIVRELLTEITPGHLLHGISLTPWLECGACDDILVRLDEVNAGGPGWQYRVAVIHPTWSHRPERLPWPATTVFDQAIDALDRLETCFPQPWEPLLPG